jgi:hypothetical protein
MVAKHVRPDTRLTASCPCGRVEARLLIRVVANRAASKDKTSIPATFLRVTVTR